MGNCGSCNERAALREAARAEALAANAGTYSAVAAAAGPLWEAELVIDGKPTTRRFTSAAAARLFIGNRTGVVRRVT